VECGYLTNEAEARRLNSAAYQEKLAHAIASSVKHFLLATNLHPKRGLIFDPVQEALVSGTLGQGNP
jgi:hypothetical protein